jgi:two-component system sensor histidine kinase DegS
LIIGATFELKAASERLAAHDEAGAARAHRQIRSVLQQVDHELRRIIFELRPPSLDDLGLAESVGRYVARFRGYTGIPAVVQIQGEPLRLPLEVEIGLYRIMQEALNNIAQHAAASAARVQLDFAAEAVTLTVVDDGRGFDTQAVRDNQRLGLVGMAERASRVGGKLRVDSHPGGGTTVTIRVPLESAMADR